MKERLDQLTLQELIELSCGDYTVLLENDEEKPDISDILTRVKALLGEYKAISSPVQARMDLADAERMSKLHIKERCACIARALCRSGHPDKAVEILTELGIGAEHLKDVESVLARCEALIGEVEYEVKRLEEYEAKLAKKMTKSPEHVRRNWYSEIASVMSILKVPIDTGINAAIYANLVLQAVKRNKAMAKMPPMAGLFM